MAAVEYTWKPTGEDAKKGSDWNFEWTGRLRADDYGTRWVLYKQLKEKEAKKTKKKKKKDSK